MNRFIYTLYPFLTYFFGLLGSIVPSSAQIKIHNNSTVKARGTIITNASLNNNSNNSDLTETRLVLEGTAQQVSTAEVTSIAGIKVNQPGTKVLSGHWEVTSSLELVEGILQIGNNAKLIYSGSQRVEGNASSFVDGFFFNRGSQRLFFPIGAGNIYAPAIIENAPAGEHGMRVVAADPAFALPEGIGAAFTGHHWEFSEVVNSPVSLSLNGMDAFLNEGVPAVLQAEIQGGIATSLSGSVSSDFVTSIESVSQPIVGVGKTAEFSLIIHDMITPFTNDGVNDKLFIENIDLTTQNKVRLLDRWGVVVHEWNNYANDAEFDFGKFSPGNYMCVVEYSLPGGSRRSVAKGMVTILKAK